MRTYGVAMLLTLVFLNLTKAQVPGPPYAPIWISQVGVSTHGSIITRTASSGGWSAAGAITSNLLSANTDGWIEFTAVVGRDYIVGLGTDNSINWSEFTHGIQLIKTSNIAYAHEGAANSIVLGTFQTGDVYRIAREGSVVRYYKNGVSVRSVSASSSLELKIKATLLVNGSSTPGITTSFDGNLVVHGTVTGTDGVNGVGGIVVSTTGGASPYTYSWSSGEQGNSIENKPHGSYSVTVTDALGRTSTRTYSIGYKINWINEAGVSNADGRLTKTAQDGSWGAGAISSNLLPANTDGWLEFVGINGHNFRIGMAVNNVVNYSQFTGSLFIDHAMGRALAVESSSNTSLGNMQTGDVFRISREGGSLKYYRNGILLRSIAVAASLEIKVKAALAVTGSWIPKITASFDNHLVVHGTVTGTDGANGVGGIVVSATGGASPYTFNWSSGEQGNSIDNKPLGIYTITVTDALGRTSTRTYSIGYKVNWINQAGVSNTDGRLTKTEQDGSWGAGAISSNLLPANTDGWLEFVGINGHNFRVGVAVNNIINYTQFTGSLFIDHDMGRALAVEGGSNTSLGNMQTGDVFRISREGGSLKYYRNGILLRSIAVAASLELKVKAALAITGSWIPKITSSFDNHLVVHGTVTGTEGANGVGGIVVSASGGALPYTFNWSSGEQGNSVENKPHGSYTVTVTDALGRTSTRTYSIGYKVNWINETGVSNADGRLTKTAQDGSWGAGAISSNLLPANTDGWLEFVGVNGHNFRVGMAVNNIINYTQFTGSLFIDHDMGRALAVESGNTSLGNMQTGDVFRISREGSSLKYYRNGILLRSIAVAASLELKVKAALAITGSSIPKISSSFDSKLVVLSNVIGLEANSGTGSITLNVIGGASPYKYSWSNGEQTSSLLNKPRGSYTVTITDALGRSIVKTYNIGYKINWINLAGVNNTNGRLTKTASGSQWTSGATSANILPANTDGWIEFVGVNGQHYMVGLATDNVINSPNFTNMIFIDYEGGRGVSYEGNASSGLGNFQTGDVFKISREGSFVKYYRNGTALRTISINPSLHLKVKACLLITNSGTPYLNSSFWQTDGIVRTYYSIAHGNWTTPSIWSLLENGPPSTVYPDDIDKVVIKGHDVTISSQVKSAGVTITAVNDQTKLKIDGTMASLEVKGNILMNRENNLSGNEMLTINNQGKLEVE